MTKCVKKYRGRRHAAGHPIRLTMYGRTDFVDIHQIRLVLRSVHYESVTYWSRRCVLGLFGCVIMLYCHTLKLARKFPYSHCYRWRLSSQPACHLDISARQVLFWVPILIGRMHAGLLYALTTMMYGSRVRRDWRRLSTVAQRRFCKNRINRRMADRSCHRSLPFAAVGQLYCCDVRTKRQQARQRGVLVVRIPQLLWRQKLLWFGAPQTSRNTANAG